ncbi:hypothetical protein BDV18DRAFT_48055 [Aspergillus unguis]
MDYSYSYSTMRRRSSPSLGSRSSSLRSESPVQRFLSPEPSPHYRQSYYRPSDELDNFFLDAPQYHRRQRRRTSGKKARASQVVSPDIIDRLDTASRVSYHHEGPYDAVYSERNKHRRSSPLDALRESNAEALKATPPHMIADAIDRRRPLDGVAFFPPGHTDRMGKTYDYEEGQNMFTAYSRCPLTDEDFRNDPFYNTPAKPFALIRNMFRRKQRVSS